MPTHHVGRKTNLGKFKNKSKPIAAIIAAIIAMLQIGRAHV